MAEKEKNTGKDMGESFGEMFKKFGDAMSEVFNDPKLKKSAKEFSESAKESFKNFGDRFKDDEVRERFKDVGKAAKDFGKSVSDYFEKEADEGKTQENQDKTEEGDDEESEADAEVFKAEEKMYRVDPEVSRSEDYEYNRGSRIAGYSITIAWNLIFIIFFNFFNQYIAYFESSTVNGVTTWTRYPFITDAFQSWLPIVTVALAISIVGNIILIINDRRMARDIVNIVMNLFGIAAVVSLLVIFPFDFTVFPNNDLSNILNPTVTVVLVLITIGLAIGTLVRFIKLIIGIARNTY